MAEILKERRWAPAGLVLIAVLAIAGLALVALRPPDVTDGRPSTASGPSYLFLGDSLSANYYATTAAHGYRELVTDGTHGRQAAFVGAGGETVSQVLGQLLATPNTGADTVIVEVGTNDLIHGESVAVVRARYALLVRSALAQSAPHAGLFCLGLWSAAAVAPTVGLYDAALQQVCAAAKGHWVPLTDLFLDPANRGPAGTPTYQGASDDYHPNDAGHRAIAARLMAAIRATHS